MGSRTRKAAPARPENTEGVGESRGYESASGILLRRGAEVFRRPFFTIPGERRPVKLKPLSRRRPPASTGPAMPKCDAFTAFRLAPARLTQSSTSFEVED